jgi:hypothetical protein
MRGAACGSGGQLEAKDALQLANSLRKSEGTVRTRNDQFRLGSRKMRTPIGHHAIRAARCVTATPVTDDRVVRRIDGQRVESFEDRVSW